MGSDDRIHFFRMWLQWIHVLGEFMMEQMVNMPVSSAVASEALYRSSSGQVQAKHGVAWFKRDIHPVVILYG